MKLEMLLDELGRRKGAGKLSLDSMGKCRLVVNDKLFVNFEHSLDGHGFFLYSDVAVVRPEKEQAFFLTALQSNLFFRETGGASFGYHSQRSCLILFRYLDELEINYPFFENEFDKFAQYAFYWITYFEQKSR